MIKISLHQIKMLTAATAIGMTTVLGDTAHAERAHSGIAPGHGDYFENCDEHPMCTGYWSRAVTKRMQAELHNPHPASASGLNDVRVRHIPSRIKDTIEYDPLTLAEMSNQIDTAASQGDCVSMTWDDEDHHRLERWGVDKGPDFCWDS
jgi:hypothetical protein